MSTRDPSHYTEGDERYVNFARDFLDLRLARLQANLLRAVAQNQRTLIWGANGPGKSFITAALKLGFLYTNPNSIVLGTSGSYGQYHDTMWKPLDNMFEHAQETYGLPGVSKGGNQPVLELDTEWYCKVVSPRSPDELEGRHGSDVLVVIDEADKPYVTEEHFDSGGSSITDLNDKIVAICNPPTDETNVVYKKREDPRWQVVEFSSFDAHNVLVDVGRISEEPIPGIVDLITLADDWEAWNRTPWPKAGEAYPGDWPGMAEVVDRLESGEIDRDDVLSWLRPGFDIARRAHEDQSDLDERWYRRRAGVMPPDTATRHRPFTVENVESCYSREYDGHGQFVAMGYDVARMGGDWNALVGYTGEQLVVVDRWKGVDHEANFDLVSRHLNAHREARMTIDASGEGSAVADRLIRRFGRVTRFNAGSEAADSKTFYNCWDEMLHHLGQAMKSDLVYYDEDLKDELIAAARSVEYEEKYYASRDTSVMCATPKDEVKQQLGRSPDVLDAAGMAIWHAADETKSARSQQLTW